MKGRCLLSIDLPAFYMHNAEPVDFLTKLVIPIARIESKAGQVRGIHPEFNGFKLNGLKLNHALARADRNQGKLCQFIELQLIALRRGRQNQWR